MTYSQYKMPKGFRGFPSCPECGEKNFTRHPIEYFGKDDYYFTCDSCGEVCIEENLVYPDSGVESDETPEPEDPLHRSIKDWSKPEMRRRVEEAVQHEIEQGNKVFRVRRPDQLD